MSTPIVYIYPPPGGFLSLPANPFYDHRRDREERMRNNEEGDDMAKEFTHFCDVCERGFDTEHQYRSHLNKHIWCDVPGCRYTCLKGKDWKMEMHKTTLHDRDDAPDLLNTEKYLASRKKKFPTAEKILTKMEEYQLRVARGDYISKEQWRWLKRQEYMTMTHRNVLQSVDHSAVPPLEDSIQMKGEAADEDQKNESHMNDDEISNASDISNDEMEKIKEDPQECSAEAHRDPAPPIHCQQKSKTCKSNITRRQKKRKLSLFEKLTSEERINEKGQVLQALRYFVVTEYLKKIPKW